MDVPPRWFWAYAQMQPQLEAEQALARISQIAAGNGLMEEGKQKPYLDQLRRTANGGQMRAEAATEASLAMMGIRVVTE